MATKYRLISVERVKRRLSGNAVFDGPTKKDIGKTVLVKRPCVTWNGFLGYFEKDPNKTVKAFYYTEVK